MSELKYNRVVIFLFFHSISIFAVPKSSVKNNIPDFSEIYKEQPNVFENKIGANLVTLLQRLKKNRNISKTIKDLNYLYKKTNVFDVYQEITTKISKVIKTKKLSGLFTGCIQELDISADSDLTNHLYHQYKIKCKKHFLAIFGDLSRKKKLGKNDMQLANNFFAENLEEFLTSKYRTDIKVFLRKIKSHKKLLKQISVDIISWYKFSDSVPPAWIIKNISHSDELAAYIHKFNSYKIPTNRIFLQEFLEMVREIRAQIDKEDLAKDETLRLAMQVINFYNLNKAYVPLGSAYKYLSKLGRNFINRSMFPAAQLVFKEVVKISSGKRYNQSIFNLLWTQIAQYHYQEAAYLIRKYRLHDSFESLSAKIQFWAAYTMNKIGEEELATFYYKYVVKRHKIEYYSIMASLMLIEKKVNLKKSLGSDVVRKIASNNSRMIKVPLKSMSKIFIHSFKRLKVWSKLEDTTYLDKEIKYLIDLKKSDVVALSDLNRKFTHQQIRKRVGLLTINSLINTRNYLHSFNLIYKGINNSTIGVTENIFRKLFPSPYAEKIKKYSNGVDPVILLSLIRQESAFNPRAKSRMGATGLMQLMPKTARQFKRRVTSRQLENPSTNLKIGITYLKKLLNRFDGNLIFALSAYNAGETVTGRWRRDIFKADSMLHTVESIPYNETRLYVQLIFRNIFFYKYLNKNKNLFETYSDLFHNGIKVSKR